MDTTQDLLRKRFAEACTERDAIAAKAAPLRQQRDEIHARAAAVAAKADAIDVTLMEIEGPLFALHNEIASISLALGGKTGTDAA